MVRKLAGAGSTVVAHIARTLLGLALIFTGTAHLTFLRAEFHAQVPPWIPLDADFVVLASGVIEIVLGIGLIALVKAQRQFGLATAIFFLAVFPGNLAQFFGHVDAFGLNTDAARGIRLLFQPLLVLWALWPTRALSLFSKLK